MIQQFFGALAIILTLAAFVPYIRSIHRGQTIPHVFSWIIWGLTTTIVFFAQLAGGGGFGAWSIGLSGGITFYVAWMAHQRRADCSVTGMDWVFFGLSLASLLLWFVTRNPFWAVVVLTTVDTLGFGPTFRKSWHKPYEEQLWMFNVILLRNLVSIPALENISWTTAFFPVVMSLTSVVFIGMVVVRRFQIPKDKAKIKVYPNVKTFVENSKGADEFIERLCINIRNDGDAAVTIEDAGFLLKPNKTKMFSSGSRVWRGGALPVRLESKSSLTVYIPTLTTQNLELIAGAYATVAGKDILGDNKVLSKHLKKESTCGTKPGCDTPSSNKPC